MKILKKLLRRFKKPKISVPITDSKSFLHWWDLYKSEQKLDPVLILMVDDLISTPNFHKYSNYWNYLAISHIKLINEKGIENFKQTIERHHYWGEGSMEFKLLDPIINNNISISYDKKELNKKHDLCSEVESKEFNKSNLILINYLIENNLGKYLEKIQEFPFGNPITFNFQNKKYSFPLLNSILEIDILNNSIDLIKYKSLLEIGAGSGRLCSAFMQINQNLKYTIVDIPPALYIAQSNIKNNFKTKKIFTYRNFKNFEQIKKEFISSDIRFLSPEQLKLIPDKFFDLGIAIDCLHELNKKQVEQYFNNFNRLTKFFYFKCQNNQWAIFEKEKAYNYDNYPVKKNWDKIIHEKCYIPNGYFHALYEIK